MSLFKFSPIKNTSELFQAVEYVHIECNKLCKLIYGHYLPVAGNIGIFCHFDTEYDFLTKIRENLTDASDNWNGKYFKLHIPITIPKIDDIPETTYTYLYIRKPDSEHTHVGDVDFYLNPDSYNTLKQSLLSGKEIKGMKVFDRPDLDLIRLSNPSIDVSSFIGKKTMEENVKG